MGSIVIDNIVMQYGSTVVLDHLTEHIGDGEFFTVLGSSGCGKSTLLKTACGLFPPNSGRVVIDGIDIFKLSKPEMLDFHKNSGFVFQNAALVSNMSVYENLAVYYHYHYPQMKDDEIFNKLEYFIEKVGFTDDISARPSTLSMGERNMIGLIRAISHDPDYLFLDTPFANLDVVSAKRMKEIILELKDKKKTIILVTNDLNFAFQASDRIGILNGGKIVESGTRNEIINSDLKITRQLLNLDF